MFRKPLASRPSAAPAPPITFREGKGAREQPWPAACSDTQWKQCAPGAPDGPASARFAARRVGVGPRDAAARASPQGSRHLDCQAGCDRDSLD
eukprot:7026989-Pyramimonas_sp.AAC.1